jgi:hypothetical protein
MKTLNKIIEKVERFLGNLSINMMYERCIKENSKQEETKNSDEVLYPYIDKFYKE